MHSVIRIRMMYLACAAGTMLLGLASRRYAAHLPAFLTSPEGVRTCPKSSSFLVRSRLALTSS